MQNLYSSVPLGMQNSERIAGTDYFPKTRNGKNISVNDSYNSCGRISKEYADAVKTLALTQINLRDKLKYCSVPVYNIS